MATESRIHVQFLALTQTCKTKPGYYFSPIIPTKTGSYLVDLQGEIRGVVIDIQIPVEDVESTSVLDFPPKASEGSADVSALKSEIENHSVARSHRAQKFHQVTAKLESAVTSGTSSKSSGKMKYTPEELAKMKKEYYELRGWNADGSIPESLLADLGI